MKKVLQVSVMVWLIGWGGMRPAGAQWAVFDAANTTMNATQVIQLIDELRQGYQRFEELRHSNENWEDLLTKWLIEDAAALGIYIDSEVAELVLAGRNLDRITAVGIIFGEETGQDLQRVFTGFDFRVEPPNFKDFEQELAEVVFESGGALLDVISGVVESSDLLYEERKIAREMVFNAQGTDQINQGLGALIANLGETLQSNQQLQASMANTQILEMSSEQHRAGYYEKAGLLFATEGEGPVAPLQGGSVDITMWVR